MILSIVLSVLLVAVLYFLYWYVPAKARRDNRIPRVIYQKMAEKNLDPWDLARLMKVDFGFVLNLLNKKQRIDSVAAGGLADAFPNTTVEYWKELDTIF